MNYYKVKCETLRKLLNESEARIAQLEKALRDLISAHDGYVHGVGPCICAAHEKARSLMESKS